MRPTIEKVLNQYQIRKTPLQKEAFRSFLKDHAKTYGYSLTFQRYSRHGHNVMIGDPAKAKVILTAHYDTPPNFFIPIVASVGGIVPFTISQFLPLIPLLAVLAIPRLLIKDTLTANLVREGFLIAFMVQMLGGVANKHNANDNTSGVCLLLALLEDLPADLREKVCFVFFDEEEKGLIGSGKFKRAFADRIQDIPLINFDCVAHGRHFVFSAKKAFRNSPADTFLKDSLKHRLDPSTFSYGTALQHIYTSDQLHFKTGVGVAAAHQLPLLGPVLNRIHTSKDTKFAEANIETLKELMVDFIRKLP